MYAILFSIFAIYIFCISFVQPIILLLQLKFVRKSLSTITFITTTCKHNIYTLTIYSYLITIHSISGFSVLFFCHFVILLLLLLLFAAAAVSLFSLEFFAFLIVDVVFLLFSVSVKNWWQSVTTALN